MRFADYMGAGIKPTFKPDKIRLQNVPNPKNVSSDTSKGGIKGKMRGFLDKIRGGLNRAGGIFDKVEESAKPWIADSKPVHPGITTDGNPMIGGLPLPTLVGIAGLGLLILQFIKKR